VLCGDQPFCSVLEATGYHGHRMPAWGLPLGAIVAVCELAGCVLIGYDWPKNQLVDATTGHQLTDQERAFGDYTPGRYAWLLTDIRALPEPIPARGAQGLWEWDGQP